MTIQQMKNAIVDVYRTKTWKNKVQCMYDDQVIAIYYNFSKRGILTKVLKNERPAVEKTNIQSENQQLSIFDLLNESKEVNKK